MNKATPITIAGRVFYLEDPGYDMLQRYIESLRGFFAGNEARHEIMADIEGRIAERFAQLVTPTDQAIPVARVTELMDAIGRPEDIGESGSDGATAPRPSMRKLFRDPRGGVLGGVFAGFAAYARVNPTFLRLGYLGMLAIGAIGAEAPEFVITAIAAYFVLWLVLPAATTSAEWLSMRGIAVTLDSLAKLVPERLRNPSTRRGVDRVIAAPFLFLKRSLSMVYRAIEGLLTVVKRAFGLAFIAFGAFAVLGISFLAMMGMGGAPATYLDSTFTSFLEQIPFGLMVGFGALVFLIPAIFILSAGVSMFRGKPVMQPAVALGMAGVWFVAIITAGVLTTKSVMKWQTFEQSYAGYRDSSLSFAPTRLTKLELKNDVPVQIVAREGKETKIQIQGRRQELERVTFTLDRGMLVLTQKDADAACVICDRRDIRIEVTSPTPDSIVFVGHSDWRVRRPYIEERQERARIAAEASGDSTQAREDALLERVPPEVRDELRRALRGRGGEASRF